MSGELISSDWQAEFRGLLLGTGTNYNIIAISGLGDQPALVTSDRERLRRDGLIAGDDFLQGRSVLLELEIVETASTTFDDALDALMTATAPGQAEQPFVFKIPGIAGGSAARINARPRKRSVPVNMAFHNKLAGVVVELEATDPRIYADVASSEFTTLPSAGGGLNFDLTFPISFGAVSVGGTITAVNAGTYSTPVVFRVQGPCTNPRIENTTTSQTMAIAIDLSANEFLLIDTETRSVLLNGTASRFSLFSGQWWNLDPGTSSVNFRASTDSNATMSMSWRSSWV